MTAIRDEVLKQVSDPRLKVYVVWEPILPKDRAEGLNDSTAALAHEPRATQFWDGGALSGKAYRQSLDLPLKSAAWDIYFLFVPGVKWASNPPAPAFWMHQLSFLPFSDGAKKFGPLRLDAKRFREEVQKALRSTSPGL